MCFCPTHDYLFKLNIKRIFQIENAKVFVLLVSENNKQKEKICNIKKLEGVNLVLEIPEL